MTTTESIDDAAPDEPAESPADLLAAADALRDARNWTDAAVAYRAYLAVRPENWAVRVQLGHCVKERGDPAGALDIYREAALDAPDDADLQVQIGHALRLCGDTGGAWRSYARALELDPTSEPAARETAAMSRLVSPQMRSASTAGQTRQIVFDTSDLAAYLNANRTPTGIQRVQLNVTARALLDPLEGVVTVAVAFDAEGGAWREIDRELFLRLWRLSRTGGETDAPEWLEAIGALRSALRGGPDFAFMPGASLVNLGTSWWIKDYFLHVRHVARLHGVRYVPMIHDCIPLMAPEHCARDLVAEFAQWFSGMAALADSALANSEWSAADARRFVEGVLPGRDLPVTVVRLDADLRRDLGSMASQGWPARHDLPQPGEPFVLCVGTIESRKNHILLFHAWLTLIRRHGAAAVPRLVCIGKPGWLADAAMTLWSNSAVLQERVSIAHGISDTALAALYGEAKFTVTNSHYEGWGLPVTESLSFGRVPLVARNTALTEAGGEAAVYFEPMNEPDLVAKLERLIFDDAERSRLEAAIPEATTLRSWSDIANQMMRAVVAPRTASAPQREVRLPLRPGVTYPLALAGGVHPDLGKAVADFVRDGLNWYPREASGAWTRPGLARLCLDVPHEVLRDGMRLYIGCIAPDAETTISLRAYAAGARPPRFRPVVARAGERFTCLLDIAAPGRALIVEIDAGAGAARAGDGRRVGIGLTGLMLCDPRDLEARLNFLEHQAFRLLAPG